MSKPQQPELHRSGRTPADPSSAKIAPATAPGGDTAIGPVPEDNLPGHHPEVEQDKPQGPPPKPRAARRRSAPGAEATPPTPEAAPAPGKRRFRFRFEPKLLPAAAMVGVTPFTAWVDLDETRLSVRFGPWSLRTALDNVAGVDVTGPYQWLKIAGPPHLSLADRGVTFGTTTEGGACVRFHRAVRALEPVGLLRHPGATLTVEEPEAFARAVEQRLEQRRAA